MMQVAAKAINPTQLVKEIYHIISEEQQSSSQKTDILTSSQVHHPILIDDSSLFSYELCSLCHPNYPKKIIAKTGREGIKIHILDCKAIKSISLEKLIKARWENQKEETYTFIIDMIIDHQQMNLITLLSIVQELGISIDRVKIDKS